MWACLGAKLAWTVRVEQRRTAACSERAAAVEEQPAVVVGQADGRVERELSGAGEAWAGAEAGGGGARAI